MNGKSIYQLNISSHCFLYKDIWSDPGENNR